MSFPYVAHIIRKIGGVEIRLDEYVGAVDVRAQDHFIGGDVERIALEGLEIPSPPVSRGAAADGVVLNPLNEYKDIGFAARTSPDAFSAAVFQSVASLPVPYVADP